MIKGGPWGLKQHESDSLRCWCGPKYLTPCDECDDGCWKCKAGLIQLTYEEAVQSDAPLIIVHESTATRLEPK